MLRQAAFGGFDGNAHIGGAAQLDQDVVAWPPVKRGADRTVQNRALAIAGHMLAHKTTSRRYISLGASPARELNSPPPIHVRRSLPFIHFLNRFCTRHASYG